ncbi:HNH endonuclease [Gordonia phage Lton]|nr:HNH endonuclease [Gordonia phage Lton]
MKPICVTAQSLLGDRPRDRISGRHEVEVATGCWRWTGPVDRYGYGIVRMTFGGRKRYIGAHRVSWWAHRGPIQGGLQIDHLCRNRACINPWHMEPVTEAENTRRSPLVGRALKPGASGGCRRHGFTDGFWSTKRDGYARWDCRPCRRERLARFKARKAAAGRAS